MTLPRTLADVLLTEGLNRAVADRLDGIEVVAVDPLHPKQFYVIEATEWDSRHNRVILVLSPDRRT